MDPASLALGVLSASETAFSVTKFLTTTWSSYRNAPEEVLEIAHEVNICRCLMTPLGEQLKDGSLRYSDDFRISVEHLVENSKSAFQKIEGLIPSDGKLDKGSLRKWTYVLKKAEVTKHRKRLKQIQQMFMFMRETMIEAQPANSGSKDINASATNALPQEVQLTGSTTDAFGTPIMYTATLMMRSVVQQQMPEVIIAPPQNRSRLKKESPQDERRNLRALRQSPYFASDLLAGFQGRESDRSSRKEKEELKLRRSSYSVEETTESLELPSDLDAARDVERYISRWFRDGHADSSASSKQASPTGVGLNNSASNVSQSTPAPPKAPSPPLASPTTPQSPRSFVTSGTFSSEATTTKYRCDSCRDKIAGPVYECRSCDDFYLCKACCKDPKVTLRLGHRHPTTRFVEKL